MILLVLFLAHLPFTETDQRLLFTYGYLAIAAVLIVYQLYRKYLSKVSQ